MVVRALAKMYLHSIKDNEAYYYDGRVHIECGALLLHVPIRSSTRQFFLHNGIIVWATGWSLEDLKKQNYVEFL